MSSFPRARIHRTSCGDRRGRERRAANFKTPPCFFSRRNALGRGERRRGAGKTARTAVRVSPFRRQRFRCKNCGRRPGEKGSPRTSSAERLWMRPHEGRRAFLFFGETAGYASPTFRGALSAAPKNRKTHRDLQSIFANPMNSWRVLGRKCSETVMVTAPFCGESGPWRLKKLIAGVPTEGTGSSRANERDRGKNRT